MGKQFTVFRFDHAAPCSGRGSARASIAPASSLVENCGPKTRAGERKFSFVSRAIAPLRFFACAFTMLGVALAAIHAQTPSTISSVNSQPETKMKHFVIIFRQGPRALSKADLERRQQAVSAWAREQNAAGHKLEPRILAPDVVRPGPAGEHDGTSEAWPITALLFLEASDLAEAARIAGSHPAKDFGVSVEVRPWAPPVVPAAAAADR